VVDPIGELARLARDRGVLCHVDACLGGWLLPFLERLGEPLPPWDFRIDGVTSVSADVHKYGWTFKGASVLLHRDRSLLQNQFFIFDGWPGGVYGSATTAGTRPGAPIAAAWATLRYLGEAGYLRLADQVREASTRFHAGVAAVEGLRVTGDPVPGIMEISSDVHDLTAVGEELDRRGWHLDRQQGGLHAMLSPSHVAVADEFLADLAAAVEEFGGGDGEGSATTPTYGGTG
jgi:sphinganine-1-phosphate aldolase